MGSHFQHVTAIDKEVVDAFIQLLRKKGHNSSSDQSRILTYTKKLAKMLASRS